MDNTKIIASFILGFFLAIGIIFSGYLVGNSLQKFRSKDRIVSVKGLAEKDVRADYVVWKITFEQRHEDLVEASKKFAESKNTIIAFLKERNIGDNEIFNSPTNIQDISDPNRRDQTRPLYKMEGEILIKSEKVDLVARTFGEIDTLIGGGVILTRTNSYEVNPRYLLRNFNKLRPEMIELSTLNAKEMAKQFSKDSTTKIGPIKSADQGTIQIYASDGTYNEESTIEKKLRVVSHITFAIE